MNLIDIINTEFQVVICLNGRISKGIKKIYKNELLIAADGAFLKLIDLDLIPNYVIGDFDSIGNIDKTNYDKVKFIEDSDQETNDFEKILKFCLDNNFQNILIFGINGGLLEHTLNNLSVLKKFNKKMNLYFYDRKRIGKIIDHDIELNTHPNSIISLVPFPRVSLSTSNLKWQLNNEILEIGFREGHHNIALDTNIKLENLNGELIIFFDYNL